jgi:hypothetical protein
VTFGRWDGDYRITATLATAPGKLVVTIAHGGESVAIKTRLTGSHNSLPVTAAFGGRVCQPWTGQAEQKRRPVPS